MSKDKEQDTFTEGLKVRRDMFGAAGSDKLLESLPDFLQPLEDLVTRYCFGEVWTRPLLDRKTRSMLTMAVVATLNRPNQLKSHVKGAIKNGVSKDEIREVLLHTAIYAGIPAGVASFQVALEALKELGLE